jgi:glycosyltransferase involved in cell wall biosynthesis
MPRVSVVLCSYNQAEYLPDAIASVFSQTHDDVELVLVDNGSTDDSQAVMKRYESDPRVKLVLFDKNDRIGPRLNAGIQASTGEYISLLYSDDYYLPHKLASQVKMFEKLGPEYGVVYSPGIRHDVRTGQEWEDPSPRLSGNVLHHLLTEDSIIHPISPLVRRECFERYPFREDVFVEGEGIYLRIAMTYLYHFDDVPTAVMRDHAGNIGRAIRRNVETTFLCLDKLEQEKDFPPSELPTLRRMRIHMHKVAGWLGIRMMQDRVWAREMVLRGIALDKRLLLSPKVVATLALTATPQRALVALNRLADVVRGVKGNSNIVDDTRVV